MDAIEAMLKFVGAIVIAGGGLVLLVFQAFKHLSTKWLDSKFEERLQALRHEHEKDLEQLRLTIATLLDRTTKLHQREFEVLPEAWSKLNDSFWRARQLVAMFQQHPDIDRMTTTQQEDFISQCRLADWEKTELRSAIEKTKAYKEHIFWHDLHSARGRSQESYSFSAKNGIFFGDDIRERFSAINNLIWNAILEHELNHSAVIGPMLRESISELNLRGEGLMTELEGIVRDRLRPTASVIS